jgi:hypothetical protein
MVAMVTVMAQYWATEGESIYLPWLGVHFEVCKKLYVYFFLVNT